MSIRTSYGPPQSHTVNVIDFGAIASTCAASAHTTIGAVVDWAGPGLPRIAVCACGMFRWRIEPNR